MAKQSHYEYIYQQESCQYNCIIPGAFASQATPVQGSLISPVINQTSKHMLILKLNLFVVIYFPTVLAFFLIGKYCIFANRLRCKSAWCCRLSPLRVRACLDATESNVGRIHYTALFHWPGLVWGTERDPWSIRNANARKCFCQIQIQIITFSLFFSVPTAISGGSGIHYTPAEQLRKADTFQCRIK